MFVSASFLHEMRSLRAIGEKSMKNMHFSIKKWVWKWIPRKLLLIRKMFTLSRVMLYNGIHYSRMRRRTVEEECYLLRKLSTVNRTYIPSLSVPGRVELTARVYMCGSNAPNRGFLQYMYMQMKKSFHEICHISSDQSVVSEEE